ncbi:hypothetical protein COCMIDRAFT_6530 [Bipolaris oryzae ATCC 44560]|uniref:Protein kinase domain-containing protein n=1 Tax=Bipolaris oryzae ATCC 44560 TaxID=930090 RepID=W6ZKM1_COCMI|nr:uncharacterized protein COCMIDRAFT_6530 [Bipolaris oryzae ATCC 44560]EUC44121.1 hypothetical protein COCMIDRAFT_6530 [Bipolaris oryzae ATCC 44560]
MVGFTVTMREGAELVGEHGYRYLLVKPLGQSNVWVAVDAATQEKIFIVKQPSDDDVGYGWPRFQHEMVMHELLKGIPTIRQQVDRIPPVSRSDPPRIVLEILQSTLWDARRKRQFSDVEIKGIMRSALLGLRDVHQRDLVYADLKMQNILLSGFEEQPNQRAVVGDNKITTKLGDLGIVMEPAKGLVQPIIYRAPEVYFRNEISPAADIWSWGLIYCQLLEAQAAFNKYGIYDELLIGNQGQKERSVERAIAHDFGLGTLDYYDGCRLPYRDNTHYEGQQWDKIVEKGVPEKEVQFLKWVLNPVPTDRPTAQDILNSGWFTTDDQATGRIAETLKTRVEESRRKHLLRKHSEPFLSNMSVQQPVKNTQVPLTAAASTTLPPTPMPQVNEQPVAFEPVAFQPFETSQYYTRPAASRSSTQRPAGGTFMNYGSFMR